MSAHSLTDEQRALVVAAYSCIERVLRSFLRRFPLAQRYPEDDFRDAGTEALTRAATRFDPSLEVPFIGYAWRRVRGAMLDELIRMTGARDRIRVDNVDFDDLSAADDDESRPVVGQLRATLRTLALRAAEDATEVSAICEEVERLAALVPEDWRPLLEALYIRGLTLTEYADELGVEPSTVMRRNVRLLLHLQGRLGVGSSAPLPRMSGQRLPPHTPAQAPPRPGPQARPLARSACGEARRGLAVEPKMRRLASYYDLGSTRGSS